MRKIDLRITDARKRLADSIYKQRAVEVDREYSHITVSETTFPVMLERDKRHLLQIYAQWMKLKIRARLATYLDAFKEEGVIPDDADLSEMSWAFQEIVDNFTAPLPRELSSALKQLGRMQSIEDARRDIEIFAQKMSIEQLKAESRKPQPPSGNVYNMYIGENRGPIQQGGEGNTQNVNINAEFEAKIKELSALVENSSLTKVQKLKAVNDIRAIHELSRMETTLEVQQEASGRLDGVTSVISLSADLVSLGMPMIQILRAFFGI